VSGWDRTNVGRVVRVCVVGSVNVDQIFTVAALPRPGETVLAESTRSVPGGKGGNQAVAAARAGARVQLVAALGTDPAAGELRAHLARNGVGVDGVVSVPGNSGSAVIVVDAAAENTIVVAPGANSHLTMDSAELRRVVADTDVLLLQLEIPIATAVAAARVARLAGATVIVNASPAGADPAGLPDLAASTDVVVINESEAPGWRWPVPHLVITRGARGATYIGADGEFAVPSPAVEAIDTTGAGDVFAGVLAASWPGNSDPVPTSPAQRLLALQRACAAGALATLVVGAGDCAPGEEAIDDAVTQGDRT
jgi:ribokinase